jgi:signal transduction histidine kinase
MTILNVDDPRANSALRITVIDDDLEESHILQRLLERSRTPFVLHPINDLSRPDALAIFAHPADAILLDHNLGSITGDTLLAQANSTQRPPVIVLTQEQDPDLVDLYLTYGVEDFLRKGELTGDLLERTLLFSARQHGLIRDLRTSQEAMIRQDRLATTGRLCAGAAHEYNNLNAVILGEIERLMPALAQATDDLPRIQRIIDALERSRTIGTALTSLSTTPGRDQCCDLRGAIQDAIDVTNALARRSGVAIRTELGEGSATVALDAQEVRQLVQHLLVNAIHALWERKDGVAQVALQVNNGRATITVSDDGVGVRPEDSVRIFDPFFSRKGGGMQVRTFPLEIDGVGLGLTVVRTLVERIDGEIDVQSTHGKGTTVTVSLPVSPFIAKNQKPSSPVTGKKTIASIAVVDDNTDLLHLVGETLSMAGYQVKTFEDPRDLLESMHTSPCDAVVMDWRMPSLSGAQVLKGLNAAVAGTDRSPLPVVIMSGGEIDLATLPSGIHLLGQIQKPFRMRQIVELFTAYAQ